MKKISWLLVLVLVVAIACDLPTVTPTDEPPTMTPTETVEPPTSTPTMTQEPPTATSTPTDEPTQEPPEEYPRGPNRLFANPGFEGDFHFTSFPDPEFPDDPEKNIEFSQVSVAEYWDADGCYWPATPANCPAYRQGEGNPDDLVMGRPEYQATIVENRVRSGETAQKWFCFFRTCQASVYQKIDTVPGQHIVVGAYVQLWSASYYIPNQNCPDPSQGHELYHSDTCTQDDRDNAWVNIRIDPYGGDDPFADHVLVSRNFGFEEGLYDAYGHIQFDAIAQAETMTIWFENSRLWPFTHNDTYLDDAYAYVYEVENPTPTPTPGPGPTATPTLPPAPPTADPDTAYLGGIVDGHYQIDVPILAARTGPNTIYNRLWNMSLGDQGGIHRLFSNPNGEVWGCVQVEIAENPACTAWIALQHPSCVADIDGEIREGWCATYTILEELEPEAPG